MKVGLLAVALVTLAACQTNPPVSNPSPTPKAEPLIYARLMSDPTTIVGFDWSGQRRASTRASQLNGVRAVFLDQLGQPIPDTWKPYYGYFLADDDRHVCSLGVDPKTFVATLSVQGPREPTHEVARLQSSPGPGFTSIELVACSVKSDRAIAYRSDNNGTTDVWVIRLSNGEITAHRTYEPLSIAGIVGNADGTYLAENSALSWRGSPQGATSTVVRRITDWHVVLTLPGQVRVSGFSADNSRVLTIKEPPQFPGSIHSEIFDRSSKRVLWKMDGLERPVSFVARSGTGDFAFGIRWPGASSCGLPPCWLDVGLLIVHHDGSTNAISGRYITDW